MRRVEIVERLRLKGRLDVLVFVIIAVLGTPSLGFGQWVHYPTAGVPKKADWDSGLSRRSAATRRRET